ncbi:MAG TPA: hypothetical protein VFY69_04580 [Solirubrobacterales bacterium]|nr:hypothetical protein [Solirubrobacterales bacterium]
MKITPVPPVTPHARALPKARPSVRLRREGREQGDGAFRWDSLIPLFVHPLKVAIIEALIWVDQPLSPTELLAILGKKKKHDLGVVAYHVNTLAKKGVIEVTHERQVRGARETYYSLSRSK